MQAGTTVHICSKCLTEIGYYNNKINSVVLPDDIECYCDGMICVGAYSEALKTALRNFKFNDKPSYFRAFAELLAHKLENLLDTSQIDLIVPVPLSKSRLRQRGYNQSELIAKHVSRLSHIPFSNNVLLKMKDTKSQSTLSRADRLINLENSFFIKNSSKVYDKNILIIDDIITTGSTVNECSKALKSVGAKQVLAGVIATTRAT